jgi:hypothetical protein
VTGGRGVPSQGERAYRKRGGHRVRGSRRVGGSNPSSVPCRKGCASRPTGGAGTSAARRAHVAVCATWLAQDGHVARREAEPEREKHDTHRAGERRSRGARLERPTTRRDARESTPFAPWPPSLGAFGPDRVRRPRFGRSSPCLAPP